MDTNEFFDYIKKIIEADQKALDTINNFLENAPPGSVTIEAVGNFLDCRHVIYDEGKVIQRKYIPVNERKIVEDLAKKSYYQALKEKLENEINLLTPCYNDFIPEEKYKLYDELSSERKLFVSSLFETIQEKINTWNDMEYIPNTSHPENLIYETNKGELRRSKSERDISNALDACSDIIAYRYEPRTYLPRSNKYLYPDFFIINLKTAQTYYWEHFGGFGKDEYNTDYAFKMQCYMMESPDFKKSLLTTYETANLPLQPKMIESTIERIIKSK